MKTTKAISFAYPTSTTAVKMGRSGYVVSRDHVTPRGNVKSNDLKVFATKAEAKAFADTMPEEYSRWTM